MKYDVVMNNGTDIVLVTAGTWLIAMISEDCRFDVGMIGELVAG